MASIMQSAFFECTKSVCLITRGPVFFKAVLFFLLIAAFTVFTVHCDHFKESCSQTIWSSVAFAACIHTRPTASLFLLHCLQRPSSSSKAVFPFSERVYIVQLLAAANTLKQVARTKSTPSTRTTFEAEFAANFTAAASSLRCSSQR